MNDRAETTGSRSLVRLLRTLGYLHGSRVFLMIHEFVSLESIVVVESR